MSVIFGPGIGQPPAQGSLMSDTNAADKAAVVVQATDTQTGNLMEFRDPSGTLLSFVDITGAFGGSAGLSGAVILAPATTARNTIQPTADNVVPFTVQAHSAANTSPLLQSWTDPTQAFGAGIDRAGCIYISPSGSSGQAFLTTTAPAGSSPTNALSINYKSDGAAGDGTLFLSNAGVLTWQIRTTTTNHSPVVITPSWEDATEATRKGRLKFEIRDSGGTRQPLDLGANGTEATIGFLGAAKVARQTNGTAADLAAIADAPAKAFVTALSTALVNLGLLAAPA